jgi:iron complex transport system permease protein
MNNKPLYFHIKSLFLLAIILIILIPLLSSMGTADIPLSEVFAIISKNIGFEFSAFDYASINPSHEHIIINLRIPRVILSGLVGAILALVGSSFQAVFRNPLADPYVMGTSSGAAFGVTLGLILGINTGIHGVGLTTFLAFTFAVLTTIGVYKLAKIGERISTTSILLAGIVASSIITSFISLIMIFNREEIANIVLMTMGSFSSTSWNQIYITLPIFIIGTAILLFKFREMNALVMGDNDAHSLGINTERSKTVILLSAAILVAVAVASSGIIGFVGIIVPHFLRILYGSNHRSLLPLSIVTGAIFLMLCDTISRTALQSSEIPIGIITALLGGPFFLIILKRHKNRLI